MYYRTTRTAITSTRIQHSSIDFGARIDPMGNRILIPRGSTNHSIPATCVSGQNYTRFSPAYVRILGMRLDLDLIDSARCGRIRLRSLHLM